MAKLINLIQIFKVLQNWVQLQYSLLTRRMNFTNRRMNFTKVKSIPGVQFFCGPPSQKLRASFGLTVACLEPVRGGGAWLHLKQSYFKRKAYYAISIISECAFVLIKIHHFR